MLEISQNSLFSQTLKDAKSLQEFLPRLSQISLFFQDIASDIYPGESFNSLLKSVRQISPELADELQAQGISFLMVWEGDCFQASGWTVDQGLRCDLEEWRSELDEALWDDLDDNCQDQIRDAVRSFEGDVLAEIEDYCQQNFALSLEEAAQAVRYTLLGKIILDGTPESDIMLHGSYWHYDGNHHAGRNCERDDPHEFGLEMISHLASAARSGGCPGLTSRVILIEDPGDGFGHHVDIAAPADVWEALKKLSLEKEEA